MTFAIAIFITTSVGVILETRLVNLSYAQVTPVPIQCVSLTTNM
jgi:hypothetical protein